VVVDDVLADSGKDSYVGLEPRQLGWQGDSPQRLNDHRATYVCFT